MLDILVEKQDTFSEFDPNYIGIGYGGNDHVPNSPFQSSKLLSSQVLMLCRYKLLKIHSCRTRFGQIVFANHSHFCFTELQDQSYKLKEGGTSFLIFVISKAADDGWICV